jgi:hypothetical protein
LKKAFLLLAVRGKGGSIEVEDQFAGGLALLLQEQIEKELIDLLTLGVGDLVFQARERRLGGERGVRERRAADGDLEDGIGTQEGRVIGVLIACGHLVDALADQMEEGMMDALLEAGIFQASGDALGEAEVLVEACHEEEAPIGREGAAVEVDLKRLVGKERKLHRELRTSHGRDGSFLGVRSITQRTIRRGSETSLHRLAG